MIEYAFLLFLALALTLHYAPEYVPIAVLVPIAAYSISEYRKMSISKKYEEDLPSLLLEIAISGIKTDKDLYTVLEKAGYPKVSGKIPADKKIKLSASLTGSPLVEKAVVAVLSALHRGARTELFLKKLAEGVDGVLNVRRELLSSLFLQKYTILISAALLVPFILATTQNFTCSFGGENPIVSAVSTAIPFHLFFLSLFTGIFASFMDGNLKNSLIYIPFLFFSSYIVYTSVLSCP